MSSHTYDFPLPIYNTTKPKHSRPKHQISRSITETAYPGPRKHHHIHRHHHKDNDSSGAPSLNPNGLLIDGTKSEGVSPEESRDASRRASLLQISAEIEGSAITDSWREERRVVKDGEVGKEKERVALRAAELRNSLNALNTRSHNTMMRLDTSYYSVLEKLSTLQSTVTAMRELARLTKELNEEFKHESEDVVSEISTSLNNLSNFEEQQKRIEGLEAQVRTGREKIKIFAHRVEIVKEKVDAWERSELEWQERTRKRLKVLWIIMACCGVICLGFMAFQMTPARTQGPGVMKGLNISEFGGKGKELGEIFNENWTLKRGKGDDAAEKLESKSKEKEVVKEDPRLRLFDEL